MAVVKNVSPLGALDIPLLGKVVGAGEEFEVPASVADVLLQQPDNFQPVTKSKKSPTTNASEA